MNIDRASIDKIAAMDNDTLRDAVMKIADAMGVNSGKAQKLLGDMDGLRSSISQLSPQEAEKLLDMAGRDKSEEIYKMIKDIRG